MSARSQSRQFGPRASIENPRVYANERGSNQISQSSRCGGSVCILGPRCEDLRGGRRSEKVGDGPGLPLWSRSLRQEISEQTILVPVDPPTSDAVVDEPVEFELAIKP
jgi:hypothetical protein